ncbi:MAG TPA: hypothetical protein VF647_22670 [Longimicrobium sp.]|jgi:hypothetical protein
MGYVLLWLPLVWALRFLLLVLTGGILYISTLYLARFLRPANARALFSGGLPALTSVGGTAKVLGQEVTLNAEIDSERNNRLTVVEDRVGVLESRVRQLRAVLSPYLDVADTPEEPHA